MSQIRILEVTDVQVQILKSHPPKLVIIASGKVPTSGWSHGALVPWIYVTVPQDGIQDLDFVATPPDGISLPVVLGIAAQITVEADIQNYWGPGKPLAGVRIHARDNSVVYELKAASEAAAPDAHVQWSWKAA